MRKSLRRLWTDCCDIWVRESVTDAATGRTVFTERLLFADLPCRLSFRLSFETVGALRDGAGGLVTAAGQAVKLFMQPDIEVPPGCKLLVRRKGHEMVFARSGIPAVYENHQEIRIERFERWV